MSIYSLTEASCDSCTVPVPIVQPPDPCDLTIEGVAPVAIGWIDCDVDATDFPAEPTVGDFQTLITANRAAFRPVVNFVTAGKDTEDIEIDAWIPPVPNGFTQNFTFEDPYYDHTNKTCKEYWDDKLKPSNFRKRFFVAVFANDKIIAYRSATGYSLKLKEAYDASAKTNKRNREFELDIMWQDTDNQSEDWYIVAGITAALGANI